MEILIKSISAAFISLVLCQVLAKQNKDTTLLLTVAVCCVISISAIHYIHPLLEFLRKLKDLGGLDSELFSILLKAVGISLLTEMSVLICKDFKNEAMGKTLQILATAVILWISLPLLNQLIDLVASIMEIL